MSDAAERLLRLWREGKRPDVRAFLADAGALPPDEVVAVLSVDQRERWLVGERVPAEHYLRDHPGLFGNPEGAVELIYGEFLLREGLGESPTHEEYLRRFPDHAGRLAQQFRFHDALGPDDPSGPSEGNKTTGPEDPRRVGGVGPADPPGYEILGLLGKGGMGIVYKARHLELDRVVALKMILHGTHATPEQREQFRREAEAVARLQHPNVVQIFEIGRHRGESFLALEYVPGPTLAERCARTPQEPRLAADWVAAVAAAVHHVHERGVVHRDLKPVNIILAEGLTPKVTDFGLARSVGGPRTATASGHIAGTPNYMAPEQASGLRVGPAADVWALGAILYECLTGRPPFLGANSFETLAQVRDAEPVPVRRLQPKVPRDLETICLKCFSKNPRGRYGTALELADDLRRFLDGRPVVARPVNSLGRAARWARRRPAVAALLTAVLVLSVAGASGLTWWSVDAANMRAEKAENDRDEALERARLAKVGEEKAEDQLAEGLLISVGPQAGPLSDAELNVFHRLAEYPADRVRLLFIEKALGRPEKAVRLGRLGEVAARAVVGLDRGRRDQFLRLLSDELRRESTSREGREACVRLGVAVEPKDKAFCLEAADAAVEVLGQTADLTTLIELSQAVGKLADHVPQVDADRVRLAAAAELHKAMTRFADPASLSALAEGVVFLADGLTPALADRVCAAAVDGILDTPTRARPGSSPVPYLMPSLGALASHLSPESAEASARKVLDGRGEVRGLGRAVALLANRLPRPDAERICAAVADKLLQVPPATPFDPAEEIVFLTDHLAPPEAESACRAAAKRILDLMARPLDSRTQMGLAKTVSLLADRLPPGEADSLRATAYDRAPVAVVQKPSPFLLFPLWVSEPAGHLVDRLSPERAGESAKKALDLMNKAAPSHTLPELAVCASALAGRLPAEDADKVRAAAADKLLNAVAQTPPGSKLTGFDRALSALAARMKTGEGDQMRRKAVAAFLKAADRDPSPLAAYGFGQQIAQVAPHRPPGEPDPDAAAAADKLLKALPAAKDASSLANLGRQIGLLAKRLPRDEAAPICAAAAGEILKAIREPKTAAELPSLVEAMASLGDHLAPPDADRAAAILLEGIMANPREFLQTSARVRALGALGGALSREAADRTAARLLDVLAKISDPGALADLSGAASALAVRLEPERAEAAADAILSAMIRATSSSTMSRLAGSVDLLADRLLPHIADRLRGAAAVRLLDGKPPTRDEERTEQTILLTRLQDKLSDQGLVELLKRPTCVGTTRVSVLTLLSRRLGPPVPAFTAAAAAVASLQPSPLASAAGLCQCEALTPGGRLTFTDSWEAVDWLRENRPDLSLSTPPPPSGR